MTSNTDSLPNGNTAKPGATTEQPVGTAAHPDINAEQFDGTAAQPSVNAEQQGATAAEPSMASKMTETAATKLQPISTQSGSVSKMVERLAQYSAVVSAVSAVVSVITAYFMFLQFGVMTDQLRVMENQQRPWVKFDSLHVAMISMTPDGGMSLNYTAQLTNIGQAPAIDVDIKASVVPLRGPIDVNMMLDRQMADCKSATDTAMSPYRPRTGKSLFPSSLATPILGNALVSATELERVRKATKGDTAQMSLVGCVVYRFSVSSEAHRTAFAYDLSFREAGATWGSDLIPIGRELSGDQLLSRPSVIGNDYAD